MRLFDLPYDNVPERIDDANELYEDIAQSMGDVARSNRIFGGTHTVITHISKLLCHAPVGTEVRILDIATGSADIPHALLAWGEKRGLKLTIIAIDNQETMLRMAQQVPQTYQLGTLHLIKGDAQHLPFAPKTFDIAICALAFHHFGFELSAQILKAMDSLTTRGLIVTDLRRDWPSLLGVHAALTLIRSHPITRHDGPASVRRAFTIPEYRKMVALSGVQNIRIFQHVYYRIALVQDKRESHHSWV